MARRRLRSFTVSVGERVVRARIGRDTAAGPTAASDAKLAGDAVSRPGAPEHAAPRKHLTGKPIRYYRPRGSADIRHLIDEGFQAFNAARLGEACRIFTDKMLLPETRHDHRR